MNPDNTTIDGEQVDLLTRKKGGEKVHVVITEAEAALLLGMHKQLVKEARLKGKPFGRCFKKFGMIWYVKADILESKEHIDKNK